VAHEVWQTQDPTWQDCAAWFGSLFLDADPSEFVRYLLLTTNLEKWLAGSGHRIWRSNSTLIMDRTRVNLISLQMISDLFGLFAPLALFVRKCHIWSLDPRYNKQVAERLRKKRGWLQRKLICLGTKGRTHGVRDPGKQTKGVLPKPFVWDGVGRPGYIYIYVCMYVM